jgi:serine/threonine-protein kinase
MTAKPDILSGLQTTLGNTYTLERELGGGGMSRVFVATDAALDRRVVVKVLSAELAQGLSADRFTREIRLAAALQDPHIVPVLSAGTTTDGFPYYTMPFVEGRSLRARLTDGQVPIDDALRILRDIGEALEYAHGHGVVHRDIKPENVLLAGRTAVVADFGIAKAINAAKGGTDRPGAATGALTQLGQSLGTPAYMAPEQATGDPTDHRADLYSWGLVAYELIAGAHPFANKGSAQQLIAAQVMEQPKHINEVRTGVPAPLGALVMRCLAKVPGERPASATELLAELGAIYSGGSATSSGSWATGKKRSRTRTIAAAVAGAAVIVVALGVALFRTNASAAGAESDGPPSLAVLPFEHQGDSADTYLTDGITDEIRGKLTGVRDLVVIARASSNAYRASKKTPREIAEELGVRYLLTGTVRVVGTGDARRVLVRPELVEVTNAAQPQSRWQQPVDAPASDVLRVQGEIAEKVVGAMEVALGSADRQQLVEVPAADPVAYDLYLRGQGQWNAGAAVDPPTLRRAIGFFEQAVARDPKLVEAWGAMARASSLLYTNGVPSPDIAAKARVAVERLRDLAPNGVDAHRGRGVYLRHVERNLVGAVEELKLAHNAAPSDAATLSNLASYEGDLGRFNDALNDIDASIRLDPRSPLPHSSRARLLVRLGRPIEARAAAERAGALAPSAVNLVLTRLMADLAAGDVGGARVGLKEAARDIPPDRVLAYLATYGDHGWVFDDQDQQHLLQIGVDAYGGDRSAMTTVRAQVYWWRGDSVNARLWADSAVRELRAQLRETPNDPQRNVILAQMLAHAGRRSDALAALDRGMKLSEVPSLRMSTNAAYLTYVAARTALIAGDREQAFHWLRESLDRRYYMNAARTRLDPSWIPLRNDPRFEELLRSAQ